MIARAAEAEAAQARAEKDRIGKEAAAAEEARARDAALKLQNAKRAEKETEDARRREEEVKKNEEESKQREKERALEEEKEREAQESGLGPGSAKVELKETRMLLLVRSWSLLTLADAHRPVSQRIKSEIMPLVKSTSSYPDKTPNPEWKKELTKLRRQIVPKIGQVTNVRNEVERIVCLFAVVPILLHPKACLFRLHNCMQF